MKGENGFMKSVKSLCGRAVPGICPGTAQPESKGDKDAAPCRKMDWQELVSHPIVYTRSFLRDVVKIFGNVRMNDDEISAIASVIEGSPIFYKCAPYPEGVSNRSRMTVVTNQGHPAVMKMFKDELMERNGKNRVVPIHIHPMNFPRLSGRDIQTYDSFRQNPQDPSPFGAGMPYPVILINLQESFKPQLLGFWVMNGTMYPTVVREVADDSAVVRNAWNQAKPLAYFSGEAEAAREIDSLLGPEWTVSLGLNAQTDDKALLVKHEDGTRVLVPFKNDRPFGLDVEKFAAYVDWGRMFSDLIRKAESPKEQLNEKGAKMKIIIPERLKDSLKGLPCGTMVLGTFAPECGVATVTQIVRPDGQRGLLSRYVLAVAGDGAESFVTPFLITADGQFTDRRGAPMTEEYFSDKDFFKRTPFNAEVMAALHDERILVVGCGSVGGQMSLELAKAGVGTLILADMDPLEIHNSMRHVLGAGFVGVPKTVALKQTIEEHAPTCKCVSIAENLFLGNREPLRQVMEKYRPTRILAVTDAFHVQNLCQLTAVHYGIPMMAVSCGSNAVEGEIFFWEPGQASGWKEGRPKRGCYTCAHGLDAEVVRSGSFDYSTDAPGSYGGEPALGVFINRINMMATIYMIAWILRKSPVKTKLASILDAEYDNFGLQYVRLGGAYLQPENGLVTASKPWGVEWMRARKIDECPICSHVEQAEKNLFPDNGGASTADLSWDGMQSSEEGA